MGKLNKRDRLFYWWKKIPNVLSIIVLHQIYHPSSQQNLNQSLRKILFANRLGSKVFAVFLSFIAAIFLLLSPWPQKYFIDWLSQEGNKLDFSHWKFPLFALFISLVSYFLSHSFSFWAKFIFAKEGGIIEKQLSEKIYLQGLVSKESPSEYSTVGKKVSLYAQDVRGSVSFFEELMPMGIQSLFPLLLAPVVLKLMMNIPVTNICYVVFATLVLSLVLGIRQSKIFNLYKKEMDVRVSIVNEWVQNIRLIRLISQIPFFEKKIFSCLDKECDLRRSLVSNGGMMNTLPMVAPVFMNITGILALVEARGNNITPGEIFAIIWILGVFMTRPLRSIPWFISLSLDGFISIQRLEKYFASSPPLLCIEGKNVNDFENSKIEKNEQRGMGLTIQNLCLMLEEKQILKNINFHIQAGELVVILGAVGSGKSLLLKSLLGETTATFDQFFIGDADAYHFNLKQLRTQFSYVPQESLMINATLRNNVCLDYFISTQNDEFLIESLKNARFLSDMEKMKIGLETPIGERGPNLSGGQKQRISLARADFFNRPIIVLDDCLSALDVNTEQEIIEHLILGKWKEKTRILVTHRPEIVRYADQVWTMEKGMLKIVKNLRKEHLELEVKGVDVVE